VSQLSQLQGLWGWIAISFIAGAVVGCFFRCIDKHSSDDDDLDDGQNR